MKIYEQLKALSLPIIEHYHDDLIKHDRNYLRELGDKIPFLHFTGDTGTFLEAMLPYDHDSYPAEGKEIPYIFSTANRWHILDGKRDCVKHMRPLNRQALILHYDGRKLNKITQDKADGIITEYYNAIRAKWHGQRKAA